MIPSPNGVVTAAPSLKYRSKMGFGFDIGIEEDERCNFFC
jgi:hypothetical protein